MKKVMLLLAVAMLMGGCTKPEQATQVLQAQGYKDIEITGYNVFGCDEKDTFHTGFTATSPNGTRVSGTVCSGILKGATVRF